jgi:imidazolonepropionase
MTNGVNSFDRVGDEFADSMAEAGMGRVEPATSRDCGVGPFKRLVLRGAMIIDGTGAPPMSPVDIVVEGDRITEVAVVGSPGVPISADRRPAPGDHEIDCYGKVVTPGFIDCHAHIGAFFHAAIGTMPTADYVYKLWLAHGVTTVREMGSLCGLSWTLDQKEASQSNRIAAPNILAYAFFPAVNDFLKILHTPEAGREWLRLLAARGADGVKFFGAPPSIMRAALDECNSLGLGTGCHHAQLAVTRMNAMTTAGWGLKSAEHFYGIAEALFTDRTIQSYPPGYDYNDEYHRFTVAGRGFSQAAEPGSAVWKDVLGRFLDLEFTFVPTFVAYDATRDVMRARRADYHDTYTDPNLWAYFQPKRGGHATYWHAWSVTDEVAWKQQYKLWMAFVNDYKNRGGRVCTGSDSGFGFQTYGFGFVRELELLQEAGFSPLEVLRSATLRGAELCGIDDVTGSIEVGKRADILVHDLNPLEDFKLLYATGAMRLNDENGKVDWTRSLRFTIKNGVVFDTAGLLADIRDMVAERKADNIGTERLAG